METADQEYFCDHSKIYLKSRENQVQKTLVLEKIKYQRLVLKSPQKEAFSTEHAYRKKEFACAL